MPKVLRIINRLNLGGPTFNAALLSRHLPPEFETLLVAGTRQDSEESSGHIVRDLGLSFTELPSMQRQIRPWKDYAAYREIRRIIRDFRPDIVHTHAAKSGALGRIAAFHENVPVVVHTFHGHVFHSYFSPTVSKSFQFIERRLARRTDAIIALSGKQKEELSAEFGIAGPEKFEVIPLGFDLTRFFEPQEAKRNLFRQEYGLSEDVTAVGIVGRLVPVKNHPMFVAAAAELLRRHPGKVRFFIIGDGESRAELLDTCEKLGIDHTYFPDEPRTAGLTFTSWRKDVDTVMAGLDIVTLTSWNEGTPVSLIEAQASGKPVVSTAVGGIEDVVLPGTTALLVPPGNQEAFIGALEPLILSPADRDALRRAGADFVRQKFDYRRLCGEMAALYQRLLNKS
ncbi:MAG: hypothetical protein RL213_1718 [Bacteroidota bacterium]